MNTRNQGWNMTEENNEINNSPQESTQPIQAPQSVSITSLDQEEEKPANPIVEWAKNNIALASIAGVFAFSVLGAGGVYGYEKLQTWGHPTEDVVAARDGLVGSQQNIPKAKTVPSAGKGTIAFKDNQTGDMLSFETVGIEAKPNNNQGEKTLLPPENISQVGWWVDSAYPGGVRPGEDPSEVNKRGGSGTTVMTSHVNYDGIVGAGSSFASLKKGDPITVTDPEGKEHHYIMDADPIQVNKHDPDYLQKTNDTLNREKGKNSLVLITCFGEYIGGATGYENNLIATARLAD